MKGILLHQLTQYYNVTENDKQRQTTARNWCITVWLALTLAIVSAKISLGYFEKLLLILTPVLLFWFLEAFQFYFVKINEERTAKVEKFIVENNDITEIPIRLFYVHSYISKSFHEKAVLFLKHMFATEIISLFYYILVVLSLIFSILLFR